MLRTPLEDQMEWNTFSNLADKENLRAKSSKKNTPLCMTHLNSMQGLPLPSASPPPTTNRA